MSIRTLKVKSKIAQSFIIYFTLPLGISIVWYAYIECILTKIEAIPAITRNAYKNPFLSVLALFGGFIFLTFVLYELMNAILFSKVRSITLKILFGIITGVLPFCIISQFAFGLQLADPGPLSELIFFGLSGALIPVFKTVIVVENDKD